MITTPVLVLGISTALQFVAAGFAIRLIRITGHRVAWGMIALGLLVMTLRRMLTLGNVVFFGSPQVFDLYAELLALAISILLAAGMAGIAPFFRSMRQEQIVLEASKAALDEAQRIAHVGSWEWNIVTDEVWWSDEHYRIYGLKPGDGRPSYALFLSGVHPDDRERVLAELDSARAEKRPYDAEYRIVQPDGTERVVHAQGGMIFKDGLPLRMRGTIQDVTASKQAAEKLRRNEAHFRALIENAPDLIVLYGKDGAIRFASPSIERILGYRPADVIGRRFSEFVHPDFVALVEEMQERLSAIPGHVERFEIKVRHADGSWHVLESTVGNMLDDPAVNAIVVNSRDVTERIVMDDQLRQAQKMQAVGQLTGGIAHDFNNLLSVVLGNLEVLEERAAQDPALLALIHPAATAAERGALLTQRLLAFSRKQALRPRIVKVNDLLLDMSNLLHRTLGETIAVETIAGAGLWPCEVDVAQLENAILNLAINARDAMPKGGKLTIEAANARLDDDYAAAQADVLPGHYVSVTVSDTGVGMSPAVVKRAIEPFFTTKEVGKGTGLGLSMVYGFVKQSGGHLTIYSEEGRGTTVRIYLPRVRADSAAAAPGQKPPPDYLARGETILVVEDDADVRSLAVTLLGDLGYRVLEAGHGRAALEILAEDSRINLLLTDMVLPGELSGSALAAEARKMRRGIRVVYMSGYAENAISRQGEIENGGAILQKPFRRAELAHKMREALDPDHTT